MRSQRLEVPRELKRTNPCGSKRFLTAFELAILVDEWPLAT